MPFLKAFLHIFTTFVSKFLFRYLNFESVGFRKSRQTEKFCALKIFLDNIFVLKYDVKNKALKLPSIVYQRFQKPQKCV
jgi:hypothetical protein